MLLKKLLFIIWKSLIFAFRKAENFRLKKLFFRLQKIHKLILKTSHDNMVGKNQFPKIIKNSLLLIFKV